MTSASDHQARANTRQLEKACRILDSKSPTHAIIRQGKILPEHWQTFQEVYRAACFVRGYKHAKFPTTSTKVQKAAAEDLEQALHRLERALKNPNLADDLRDAVPVEVVDWEQWDEDVAEARSRYLSTVKQWRERAAEARNRDLSWLGKSGNSAKKNAARYAARLLIAHNIPLTLSRRGSWCQLAALLYGEPKADFLHHCREAKADLQAKADLERDFPLADLLRDADNPD